MPVGAGPAHILPRRNLKLAVGTNQDKEVNTELRPGDKMWVMGRSGEKKKLDF